MHFDLEGFQAFEGESFEGLLEELITEPCSLPEARWLAGVESLFAGAEVGLSHQFVGAEPSSKSIRLL